jgi:hypothetical protein
MSFIPVVCQSYNSLLNNITRQIIVLDNRAYVPQSAATSHLVVNGVIILMLILGQTVP